ncbi:MAG: MnhB domain-containing protein [Micromonosporaceae bacterium]
MRGDDARRTRHEAAEHEPTHRPLAGALIAAGMLVALGVAVAAVPREHAPLPAIARYALTIALPRWKLTEPVNEIVYGTRGFDTFGETFLLLAAVVSVIVLTRPREPRSGYFGEERAGAREQAETDPSGQAGQEEQQARAAERREQEEDDSSVFRKAFHPLDTPDETPLGTPAPETAEAMSLVTRTAIRVALPILAVAGLYVVAWGFSPGGGFPAGAVVLGVALLAYAGFGRRRIASVVRPELIEVIELAGAAAVIVIELLGLLLRGSFTANWLPLAPAQTIRSGGIAQLFSVTELVEVATGLIIVIFAFIGMRHDWSPDEPEEAEGRGEGGEGGQGGEGGETGGRGRQRKGER